MKCYDLKSELAICQIFGNFGLPVYCLLINECDNEFCKIVVLIRQMTSRTNIVKPGRKI